MTPRPGVMCWAPGRLAVETGREGGGERWWRGLGSHCSPHKGPEAGVRGPITVANVEERAAGRRCWCLAQAPGDATLKPGQTPSPRDGAWRAVTGRGSGCGCPRTGRASVLHRPPQGVLVWAREVRGGGPCPDLGVSHVGWWAPERVSPGRRWFPGRGWRTDCPAELKIPGVKTSGPGPRRPVTLPCGPHAAIQQPREARP